MAFSQDFCSKSELDLFTQPRVQFSLEEDYVISSGPTDPNSSSLEFILPKSSDDYTDLTKCFLKIRGKLTKKDGSPPVHYGTPGTNGVIPDGDDVSVVPVNLILHSLWKQVDLYLNDDAVCSEGDYPYKSYFTALLSYSDEVKDTWLRDLEGWRTDEPGKFSEEKNTAQEWASQYLVNNGKEFELMGRPNLDLIMQPRLIPNNVKIRMVFTRASEEFCIMSHVDGEEYKIKILSATLSVRRCKINPEEQLKMERQIANTGAVYPVQSVIMKNITIPSGSNSFTVESVFSNGEIPPRLFIAQVANKAFVGHLEKNPFEFVHNNIIDASVSYDGQTFSYDFDFPNNTRREAYLRFLEIMGNYPCNTSSGLSYDDWERGNFIIAWDLCADQSYLGDFVSRRRLGNISMKLRWSRALADHTTLLIVGLYENSYFMSVNRTFSKTLVQ